ncbi:MAG: hypothetical protein ABIJ59_07615 [Pseudomonadota bacterium]
MKNKVRSNQKKLGVLFFALIVLTSFTQDSFAQSPDLEDKALYLETSDIKNLKGQINFEDKSQPAFEEKLQRMIQTFFSYFNLDNKVSIGSDTAQSLMQDASEQKNNSDGLKSNLFLNIDTMNGIKLKTNWSGNYLNTVYHYEKNQFELGFGSEKINELLPDKVKMELKTSPQAGSVAILFSMKL